MIVRYALFLSLGLASVAAAAQAHDPAPIATVSLVQGQVLLARGAEVDPAQEGSLLAAGDRLMALQDAQAQISYNDGCEQTLEGEAMVTIGERSECIKSAAKPASFRQALGETGAGGSSDSDDREAVVLASNSSGTTTTTLTTGQKWLVAAAVVVPIVYYYQRNRDDNDRPPVSQ